MEFISIFNDVLGPVMRGPSSSHTAGSYRIGRMARSLLGDEPLKASFTFDPGGSYARTYREQGVDLGFAAGLLGWELTDERFPRALDIAVGGGRDFSFRIAPIPGADHPNSVLIRLTASNGRELSAMAKSTGGGGIVFTELEGRPVSLFGKSHEVVVPAPRSLVEDVKRILGSEAELVSAPVETISGDDVLVVFPRREPLSYELKTRLAALNGIGKILTAAPVFFVPRGRPIFGSAAEMVKLAEEKECSLGRMALAYESEILGWSEDDILAEMARRFEIMQEAVRRGLENSGLRMQLLQPTAHKIFESESRDETAVGGIHTRAAARAMAAMHVSNSQGIVVAAPTGGSAGVIPGVVVTLAEEWGVSEERASLALFAAAAVGLIIARRATFAAEVAGCQVEIGAAGAMAAAAVVEIAGGSARQAADAAAISLQNTMGSACDLVQGICEIPCHTRNAVAAASAFVCADLIMGGYENPVPLDETIDAVYDSGRMLPVELRCTARGGLALAPSARTLPRLPKTE